MCTVVLLRRPGHRWPVLIGANRDEMASRPWRPPARHWEDRLEVVGGFDELAGGSWIGLNRDGVVAILLNRRGTLGPAAGKRSRGNLVLEALDHADAVEAASALQQLNPDAYRPFNLIIADRRDAFWLANRGSEDVARRPGRPITAVPIPVGFSLLAADDLNDPNCPRLAQLRRFESTEPPDPSTRDWTGWEALMASREHDPAQGPRAALCVVTETGFGTVSSSLIALPSQDNGTMPPVWRFAAGRPGTVPYRPVSLVESEGLSIET